jgi:hypothetical protein
LQNNKNKGEKMKNKTGIVTACLLAALLTGCAGKISQATIVGPNADGTKLGFDKNDDGIVDGAFVLSERPLRKETTLLKTLKPGMEVVFTGRPELEIPLKNIRSVDGVHVQRYIGGYSNKEKLDKLRDEFSNQKD